MPLAGHCAPCPAPRSALGYQPPPGVAAPPRSIRYLQAQGCDIHHLQGSAIRMEQVPGFVVGTDLERGCVRLGRGQKEGAPGIPHPPGAPVAGGHAQEGAGKGKISGSLPAFPAPGLGKGRGLGTPEPFVELGRSLAASQSQRAGPSLVEGDGMAPVPTWHTLGGTSRPQGAVAGTRSPPCGGQGGVRGLPRSHRAAGAWEMPHGQPRLPTPRKSCEEVRKPGI